MERARVLLLLLDPSTLQPLPAERQLNVLVGELEQYSPDLAARPRLVALNKTDLVPDSDVAEGWFPISAVTGAGVPALLHAIADEVDKAKRVPDGREGYILHRPLGTGFSIRRETGGWVIEGRDAERAVAFHDLTIPEAADLAARRLRRMGVDDALREAGAQPGDDVRIGDLVFQFTADS